jgi:hypothetical protein
LKTAITVLLAIAPWSVSAQPASQNENLLQLLSKLRTCVRAHASAAEAAGTEDTNNTINFFLKACVSPVSAFLGGASAAQIEPGMISRNDFDPAKVGAIPPGIFRRVIREEWVSVGQTRSR